MLGQKKNENEMNWEKINIKTENRNDVEAQAPIIISASRSTDIPAFYSDWFINRIKQGYLVWKNPFNQSPLFVTFQNTRLIVFWSKNPKPIIQHLDYLNDKNLNYYFQFTINDYVKEKLEPNVPSVESRIETFINLSEKIGKEKVIWRFDPLILTDKIGVNELLSKIERIGNQLSQHTVKLVFSFADIGIYRKVQSNLNKGNINYSEFDDISMNQFAQGLKELNQKWKFEISTCAEKIELGKYGINHNRCIDDDLMKRLFYKDSKLMEFLGYGLKKADLFETKEELIPIKKRNLKDKGQRELCGCIFSKDVGEYNTCLHLCEYCYANTSKKVVLDNYHCIKENNQTSETITGR
jgi:DNA repair photolyase